MAIIVPIKGLRYNQEKIKNLADVITPPYDVIDDKAQDDYYTRHPYNIIRLEYGKIFPEDNEENSRYTRAAADFARWQKAGVLLPEKMPAVYYYEQEFTVNERKKVRSGFTCGVKLEPYEKGVVLPHEETMPKHKADRLALMKACRANFSPIFALYIDRENAAIGALRQAIKKTAPDVNCTGENRETHRLWTITEAAVISQVQKIMTDKRIFIADGHHRYETALNYKNERDACKNRTPAGTNTEPAYHYVMMTLVNLYDAGLVILPAHRLVKNITGLNKDRLLAELKETFIIEKFPLAPDHGNFQDFLHSLATAAPAAPIRSHVLGLYTSRGELYRLTLRNNNPPAKLMPRDKSPAWQNLDVSVLQTLILEKYLGIDCARRAAADQISYTREEEGSLKAVDRGEFQMAFFLNPTRVEEVIDVAANGEKMPQKSTYFHPKLITGLVINKL
ncbi:MAG: DUF1015 domain-containing protein [Peptococcaceae bacterium]|nr:MAG: DUF1015 domain-containing protein [Peptococcaceae bacterium]